MKALKILLIAVILLVGLFLIAGLFAPKSQVIQQSTTIKAPAAAIFPHVMYMDKMTFWHPVLKKDPNILISTQGEDGQVGTIRFWKSDVDMVGEGFDEIVQLEAPHQIISKINFVQPRSSTGESIISLEELKQATRVNWKLSYSVPYPFNAFLFFNNELDQQNKFLAEGLLGLKNTVEKYERAEVSYGLSDYEFPGGTFLYKKSKTPIDHSDLYAKKVIAELNNFRDKAGIKKAGSPVGFILSWGENDVVEYGVGLPIHDKKDIPDGLILELPPKSNCKAVFVNDLFGTKTKTHRAIQKQLKKQGLKFEYPIMEDFKKFKIDNTREGPQSVMMIYEVKEQ